MSGFSTNVGEARFQINLMVWGAGHSDLWLRRT
jgi:hypothetical protein